MKQLFRVFLLTSFIFTFPLLSQAQVTPEKATREKPFVNSLGMRFVPVPKTKVLFCIWETRVKDFAAFRVEKPATDDEWKSTRDHGVDEIDDYPVLHVSWFDAKAFCEWLSQKENRTYRLATDHEWSVAIGIGDRERPDLLPVQKDHRDNQWHPWGAAWPPLPMSGNYRGEEANLDGSIKGYRDPFPFTAPVGSFPANAFGIHDLSGNAWEWCEDWYDRDHDAKVLRGGGWMTTNPLFLSSEFRDLIPPDGSNETLGFRCVLELK